MGIKEESLELHEKLKGKIEVVSKIHIKERKDLSLLYTPGVAEACLKIAENKNEVYKYTMKGNGIAVISDGSAVLGLGNIGPEAGLPVMEGKALLFKEFAGIDAFPICLAKQDVEGTIQTIRNIAPVFGGINLEDFKAPECFEIESRLQDLGIPVMHDDQHGTAIVVLAGLLNSLKLVSKKMEEVRVVMSGAGAAATGIMKLLIAAGFKSENFLLCDRSGIINMARKDILGNKSKEEIAQLTNKNNFSGSLSDALKGADIFIGVSSAKLVSSEMIKSMNINPIIFAMANPEPEIMPDAAKEAGASIVATGRSDFPNQVNNVLAFPGIFRGALDIRATKITTEMKIAAAKSLANMVEKPTPEMIIPSPLDKNVVPVVAEAVKKAWINSKEI
jgi:malate dehydrogenase (oxaloacetate-decarboxylating)